MHRALVGLALCVVTGGVGAWAFNPDSGSVVHSEALWRVFGIACEVGFLLLIGGTIGMGSWALIRRARRRLGSH